MEKSYATARVVFTAVCVVGYIILTIAPLWVIFFGSLGPLLGGAGAASGVLVAAAQMLFGLGLIATGQLGLAQISIANNTAAILRILQLNSAPAPTSGSTPSVPVSQRKEPWVRKSQR